MIDSLAILTAIKAMLDADTTLNTLLGTATNQSKVFLGSSATQGLVLPFIMIPDHLLTTSQPVTKFKRSTIEQNIVIWSNKNSDGMELLSDLYPISNRVVDLLDQYQYAAASVRVNSFYLVTQAPATLTQDGTATIKVLSFAGVVTIP